MTSDIMTVSKILQIPKIMIDGNFEIVSVNNIFTQTFYTKQMETEELFGEKMTAIFGKENMGIIKCAIEKHDKTCKINYDDFDFIVKIHYMSINQIDISFNKIIEEVDVFSILEPVPIAITIADKNMKIKFINHEMESLFGYDQSEVLEKNVKIFMPAKIASEHDGYVNRYVETGNSRIIYKGGRKVTGKHKNGTFIEVGLVITEQWTREGILFVASFPKIKLSEEETYNINDIAKFNATFMANMSHELRTPIHGIYGLLEMLMTTKLSEEQQKYVNICYSSAKDLIKMTDNMLLYTMAREGGIEPQKLPFEFYERIENMIVKVHSRIPKRKKIQLSYYIHDDVPLCMVGDPNLLDQVLNHIVENAIKFTDVGKIELEIEKMNENLLKFAIEDTGIGMTNKQLDRLFRPCMQVSNGTTKKYKGSGMGLSICKLLVKISGGEIFVTSRFGRGSTFVFTMNFTGNEKMSKDYLNKYHHYLFKNKTIFVIDDNAINCLLLESMLGGFGIKAATYRSVFEGIENIKIYRLKTNEKVLVLMDYHMPSMNGIEAAKELRDDNVDVILVSSFDGFNRKNYFAEIRKCRNIKYHMDKPIVRKQLYECLVKYYKGDLYIPHKSIRGESKKESSLVIMDNSCDLTVKNKYTSKVLIVDDEDTNRSFVRSVLDKYNYPYDEARNGYEAVKKVKTNGNYAVVLMDIHMPVMDGIEATKLIKTHSPVIPVVAMTADVTSDTKIKIDNTNFDCCIYKPVGIKAMLGIMKKAYNNTCFKLTENKKEGENKSIYLVLVDDKKESQIIMSKYIEFASKKLGIQINVDQFRNGKQVAEYITNLDDPSIVDCILMDIEMPVMNGYDAASEIKKYVPYIKIIGVTGYEELKFPELFFEKLTKPIEIRDVENIVLKILKNKRSKNKYLNQDIVDGLKFIGKETVLKVITPWYDTIDHKIEKVLEHVRDKNLKSLQFDLHSLKGSTYQVGCNLLGDHFKELEKMSKEETIDYDKIEKVIDEKVKNCVSYSKIAIKEAYY